MAGFSQATGILGDLLNVVSSSTEEDSQEAYEKRASAWERAQEEIDKNNQRLQERTQERNQLLSSFGNGFRLNDPTYQQSLRKMLAYNPSDTAENLKTGANVMNYISDMSGSLSSDVSDQVQADTADNTVNTPQVDTNTSEPAPDVRTAYNNRKTQDLYRGYLS